MARKIKRRGEKVAYTKILAKVLKECHLNGLIEECLLVIKKGKGSIEAVDPTNSLIAIIKGERVASKDVSSTLGLGDLALLIKFLSPITDKELSFDDTDEGRLTLRCKDKRKKLMYLLTEPELIPTRLAEEESKTELIDDIIEKSEEVELEEGPIRDFLSNITLLKTDTVRLYGKEDLVMFECGESTGHMIEIVIAKMTTFNKIEVRLSGDHLAKIFNTIDFDGKVEPKLYFSKGASAVIVKNGKTLWALLPITDEE